MESQHLPSETILAISGHLLPKVRIWEPSPFFPRSREARTILRFRVFYLDGLFWIKTYLSNQIRRIRVYFGINSDSMVTINNTNDPTKERWEEGRCRRMRHWRRMRHRWWLRRQEIITFLFLVETFNKHTCSFRNLNNLRVEPEDELVWIPIWRGELRRSSFHIELGWEILARNLNQQL